MMAAKEELKNGDTTAIEILAVLAHCTGACIALQDMTWVTPEIAMEVVLNNIQAGNLAAVKRAPRPQG